MIVILAGAHDQQGQYGLAPLAIALDARLDEVEAVTSESACYFPDR